MKTAELPSVSVTANPCPRTTVGKISGQYCNVISYALQIEILARRATTNASPGYAENEGIITYIVL